MYMARPNNTWGAVEIRLYLFRCLASESPSVTYVSPYNDRDIMAGQGTLGIEILKDLPQV